MPDGDQSPTQAPGNAASPADPVAQAMASLASTMPPADVVRTSPEYQTLQEQHRALARDAGSVRAENERLRQQMAAQQQAAEAQRAAALQQQMEAALGSRAAEFGQLAQLMQTDPVAAARRFAEMTAVQSPAAPAAPTPAAPQEPAAPPPVPSMQGNPGVSASAPLGAPPQRSLEEEAAAHQAAFEATVAANRNLQTRTRVRSQDRAAAIGNYLRGALMREHGVRLDVLGFQRERDR